MAGRYISMLKVGPPNFAPLLLIKQEYDYGIIDKILGGRPMMIPLTPRLGVFTIPKNKLEHAIGTLSTPMLHLPRKIHVFKSALVISFQHGYAVDFNEEDFAKFKMLYKVAESAPRKLRLLS